MKNLKRYIPYRKPACGLCFAEMIEDKDGGYIAYRDYIAIELEHCQEIAVLKQKITELESLLELSLSR